MPNNFDNLFIEKKLSIKEAMKQMDNASRKILFITDKDKRLLGTLTDGDIRRWILSDGDIQEPVKKVFNRQPIYIQGSVNKKEIKSKMLTYSIESLPIVDENMRIINVLFWDDMFKADFEKNIVTKLRVPLVIMAGGQGRRLDPFTRILPKALIPIGEKPVIEIIIDNFLRYIFSDIYLILGYKAEMIKSYFANSSIKYKVKYIYEGKKPLGTAGGLLSVSRNLPATFFLTNCDTIIKADYADIYNFHKKNNYDLTIISSMQHFTIPYGIINIDSGGRLEKIKEKPEYDLLVNTGMYIVEKKVLKYIPRGKPFHVTDLIEVLKKKNMPIGVYPVTEKSWLDVGQWESYKEITSKLIANTGISDE